MNRHTLELTILRHVQTCSVIASQFVGFITLFLLMMILEIDIMEDERMIKRQRLDVMKSTTMEKLRGVLPQQNGNWGAQIYANHQRIWLGTFRTEKYAAMAYDSASLKLRRADDHSQRNFPWTQQNFQELIFQSAFTEEETLDMITDGTYPSKLETFLLHQSKNHGKTNIAPSRRWLHCNGEMSCRQLFQKELTPSDVGKLNRLVIPKKYAVRYFPCIKENNGVDSDDTELVFFDRVMKTWKFRYCYWKSSQSFVFTRGWNKFVKEKEVRANDVVTFYSCECVKTRENDHVAGDQRFCLIDVNYSTGEGTIGISGNEETTTTGEEKVDLRLNLGAACSLGFRGGDEEAKEVKEDQSRVRLFGVQIN